MLEPQAGAVVEVVNDAMKNLVTKEYLKAELDRSFNKFERKLERKFDKRFKKIDSNFNELRLSIAELGKPQAWGFVCMCGFTIAVGALLFAALQFFGTGAAAAPMDVPEPGAFGCESTEPQQAPTTDDPPPPPETALEPDSPPLP